MAGSHVIDSYIYTHAMVAPTLSHLHTFSNGYVHAVSKKVDIWARNEHRMKEPSKSGSPTSTMKLYLEHRCVAQSKRRRLCMYWTEGTLGHYARARAGSVGCEFVACDDDLTKEAR